jgi:hypothetical protein
MRKVINTIYASFSLGKFEVKPENASRDTSIRFNQFEVTEKSIQGKKLLNLGSCTGAINFETYKFNPRISVGVEYDLDKVEISRKISEFCDITDIDFIRGDLDNMSIDEIGTDYDVVFCLAVEGHVKYPDRLFEIIGKVCNGLLFYEGDADSDRTLEKKVEDINSKLKDAGFKKVEYLGTCADDHDPELHVRPLFRAYK